ncbi:MAG: uroporphyrinogen decarboxylase [Hydrogenibacillus schlegelii]|uniref:Uroporphyrinogen decarboxylase n=1 Tax=Hydrogenibacillus schlegelii TaxID=1484 RepID=A0A947CWS2_HYDSH|nr:uroporphyrinogen decarboxylase [Hydrogenibacillus schlegelii]
MAMNDRFLRAARKVPVDRTPIWFMRQAGRYDPEYHALKGRLSFKDIARLPEVAAELTALPVKKLGVDAAILYADIMTPVEGVGLSYDIVAGVGPVVERPIRSTEDVRALGAFDPAAVAGVFEAIRLVKRSLSVPLIGFAGGPFTLASYLIEGRPTRTYRETKRLMLRAPDVWTELMEALTAMTVRYLEAQLDAGADAVQLFDSWAGHLAPVDYERYALPYVRRIFQALAGRPAVKIYFPGVASGELLPLLRSLPIDVVGVDWRVPLAEANRRLNGRFALQGNYDPLWLEAPPDVRRAYARTVVDAGLQAPGFIFNLGHGLYPEAELEAVRDLVATVQEYSAERLAGRRVGEGSAAGGPPAAGGPSAGAGDGPERGEAR